MKSVLIIFTDPHFAYSPTTHNLANQLRQEGRSVSLVTFEPDPNFSSVKIEDGKVSYLKVVPESSKMRLPLRLFKEIEKTFDRKSIYRQQFLNNKTKQLIEFIKNSNDELIAVDFVALWCVQQAGRAAHLLSLEVHDYDPYRRNCNLFEIISVIIQSEERYRYIFPDLVLPRFFIPNSPNFRPALVLPARDQKNLVYCGTAVPQFGIFSCLEFLEDYEEYTLTIKGAIPRTVLRRILRSYNHLVTAGRLILDKTFLPQNELNDYLKAYYIGFVFYDMQRFESIDTFNYHTAPSGKMFEYFNARVPVVASNIPGLSAITEFSAGIVISSLSSKSIYGAIQEITSEYQAYCSATERAAKHFDFSSAAAPFLSFLKDN